jgi:hypothetical protein
MHELSAFLDRYFVPSFRWLTLLVCILVAWNYIGFWWYWEFSLPGWGVFPSRSEFIGARLTLFWAFAALALGAALFDLIRSPPRVRRRSLILFCLALAGGIAPYLMQRLVLS